MFGLCCKRSVQCNFDHLLLYTSTLCERRVEVLLNLDETVKKSVGHFSETQQVIFSVSLPSQSPFVRNEDLQRL